jgi:hypothetical protein
MGIEIHIYIHTNADLKQRAKEHRWMIEDQHRQIEAKMNIAQAERETATAEEAQASMAVCSFVYVPVCACLYSFNQNHK